MSLEKLLKPRNVALIGASEKTGFAGWTARNLIDHEAACRPYFVNPLKEAVFGKKCYPSLSALPELVDCIIITTSREHVNPYLEEAGKLGILCAIVFASGYSEEHSEEGRQLENELKEIARRYHMDILGPNCMGVMNKLLGINLLGIQTEPPGAFPGVRPGVAVMGHSGALLATISSRAGFPLAYLVSVGNGAVTSLEEFIDYCVESREIRVLTLYLEGLKRPDLFAKSLRKAALRKKPVVILKAGRSERTAASAASHTGSLAGSYRSFEALSKKFGAILVDSLEELICVSEALDIMDGHYPRIPQIVNMNSSGGFTTLATEMIDAFHIPLADFSPATRAEIGRFLPSFATIANPLDTTTALLSDPSRMYSILRALEQDKNVGLVSVGADMGDMGGVFSDFGFLDAMLLARKDGCKLPYFVTGLTEKTKDPQIKAALGKAGICMLSSLPVAIKCIRKILDFVFYDPDKVDLSAEGVSPEKLHTGALSLSERESAELLSKTGIPMPRSVLVTSAGEIARQTELSYPVVMKISSKDIPHKTDAGGVKMGIPDAFAAEAAFNEILANVRAYKPGAEIDGVLVQEQKPAGMEMILGVNNDSQLGPMLLVGLGGIFAEVFQDTALAPAPVSREEALRMISGLKAYQLMNGFRGSAPLDIEALADAMVALSRFAHKYREEVKEIDINPVFVYPEGRGVCAVDALVVKYQQ